VTQALPLGQEPLLVARLDALGSRDEVLELRQALRHPGGRARELLPPAPCGDQVAPGALKIRPAPQLLLADEGVEDVELVRRTGEAALLELSGHGQQALDQRRQVLPRHGAPPRVCARAPVREDPARGDETLLPGRPQLGEGGVLGVVEDAVGQVELGLDVGLFRARSEIAGVAGRAQEETDRLGEDRLPRPGLARDRVQTRRKGEVGLADEDEALDAQTAQHLGEDLVVPREERHLREHGETTVLGADGHLEVLVPFEVGDRMAVEDDGDR
jgi:hypothetical protein